MKMFSSLLAALLLLILSASVMAQDEDEVEYVKDFLEVAVFGGGSMPSGGLTDWTIEVPLLEGATEELGAKFGFDVGFDVGYFWTLNFVTGVNFTYHQYSIDSDSSAVQSLKHRVFSPSLYGKYYFFGESNLVPYVKAHAGVDVVKFATRVYDPNVGSSGGTEYRELSYDPAFAFGLGVGAFYYTHDYGGLFIEANYHNALTSDVGGSYEGYDYDFGESTAIFDIHAGIKVFFGEE